ncbi:MAG: CDP-alcohol phosphatidyltransferase family protein [Bacteroidota bacterium]
MPKLPEKYQFLDLSDYGRAPAKWLATRLKYTPVTAIHMTTAFIVAGVVAIACILNEQRLLAALFLILKSVLDAADGELARIKNQPSYIGRYYDSIADIILNFFFLLSIWHITDSTFYYMLLAFIGIQLQGTLYNYYYVILRNTFHGDKTSRIFENSAPVALKGESQRVVNIFFHSYNCLYIAFDKAIYYLDPKARFSRLFPNWFMTLLSTFGLGFQLLIMSIFLIFHWEEHIIPFFIGYSTFIFIFITIRRTFL